MKMDSKSEKPTDLGGKNQSEEALDILKKRHFDVIIVETAYYDENLKKCMRFGAYDSR